MLTFVIPLISKDRAENWVSVQKCLSRTLNSLVNQDDDRWRAIIVSSNVQNKIPNDSRIINIIFEKNINNESKSRYIVSHQKHEGRRDQKNKKEMGLYYARKLGSDYVMLLDADDCLHRNLNSYIHRQPCYNAYVIKRGYKYVEGSFLLQKTNTFDGMCGSCFILKSDFAYKHIITKDKRSPWLQQNCTHGELFNYLKNNGENVHVIPFRAGIYNVGRVDNLSNNFYKPNLWLSTLKSPYRLLKSSIYKKKYFKDYSLEPVDKNSMYLTVRSLFY